LNFSEKIMVRSKLQQEATDILTQHLGLEKKDAQSFAQRLFEYLAPKTQTPVFAQYYRNILSHLIQVPSSVQHGLVTNLETFPDFCQTFTCHISNNPHLQHAIPPTSPTHNSASSDLFRREVRPKLLAMCQPTKKNTDSIMKATNETYICKQCQTGLYISQKTIQTRSGDEAMTVINYCTECDSEDLKLIKI